MFPQNPSWLVRTKAILPRSPSVHVISPAGHCSARTSTKNLSFSLGARHVEDSPGRVADPPWWAVPVSLRRRFRRGAADFGAAASSWRRRLAGEFALSIANAIAFFSAAALLVEDPPWLGEPARKLDQPRASTHRIYLVLAIKRQSFVVCPSFVHAQRAQICSRFFERKIHRD